MSSYHPRRTLSIHFDDSDDLVALAAHLGVTAPLTAKLAVRCLHEVLVEHGHYESPALDAHLQRTNGPASDMAAFIARDTLETAYDRPGITLHFDDGADGDGLFRLHSRTLFELARQLVISQSLAVKIAINALHRALMRETPYLSPALQAHIREMARFTANGPCRMVSTLYTQLGLEGRQVWAV